MRVEVSGSAFQITPLSPAEQLVVRAARWEFDVLPLRSGKRVLQFRVSMIIELRGQSNQYVAVPVLERGILVHVNLAFAGKRIFSANWQWVCATLLGLGGTLAAWITLFGGHKGT
jgi:hypothetical protein